MNIRFNQDFPVIYDAHHRLHPEDLPFWLGLAEQYGDPVLELGCGTGRVLLALAQAGRRVVGLDYDPAMLAFLRQNIPPALAPTVTLVEDDLRVFNLEQRFALIILPCNTYSAFDAVDRRRALAQVRQHLQPGGLFAASLPNPARLKRLPRRSAAELEEIITHPVTGNPLQVSCAWQRSPTHLTYTWYYDHLLPDGQVERLAWQARHALDSLENYRQELAEAGFGALKAYGDYDGSVYEEDAPLLLLLAER